MCDEIVALAGGKYRDYNDQHLTEVLQVERDLVVLRASLCRAQRAAGLSSHKKFGDGGGKHQHDEGQVVAHTDGQTFGTPTPECEELLAVAKRAILDPTAVIK